MAVTTARQEPDHDLRAEDRWHLHRRSCMVTPLNEGSTWKTHGRARVDAAKHRRHAFLARGNPRSECLAADEFVFVTSPNRSKPTISSDAIDAPAGP
jgi:hypothetical protein